MTSFNKMLYPFNNITKPLQTIESLDIGLKK